MSALTDLFTQIATAIRGKSGESGAIAATDFPAKITALGGAPVVVYRQNTSHPNDYTFSELVGKNNVLITTISPSATKFSELTKLTFTYAVIANTVTGGVVGGTSDYGVSTEPASATWNPSTGRLHINYQIWGEYILAIGW